MYIRIKSGDMNVDFGYALGVRMNADNSFVFSFYTQTKKRKMP